ncbi:MAG: PQQ-binding-like beta-propeller repeat protein [Planctomycetota bacterium]|nr:PQQ-binding-like beta-propeller repeat protein [Planctomycetota bacterium]
MRPLDRGRYGSPLGSESPVNTLILMLLAVLLSGSARGAAATRLHLADEPGWIPPFSSELDALVRQVEDSRASGDTGAIRDALGAMAERLIDGDPGGSTIIGGGHSIGAGPYLRSTISQLDDRHRKIVLEEIRLRTSNRIVGTPSAGLDSQADARLTSTLMDLPKEVLPRRLTVQLAEAALERCDLQTWRQLLRRGWIDDPGFDSLPSPSVTNPLAVDSGSLVLPRFRSGDPQLSESDPIWKRSRGSSGAVSDRSRVWIQQPGQVRSIDLESGEEIWRRVLPQHSRRLLPRTRLMPVRRQQSIIATLNDKVEAFDGSTGDWLWQVSIDQILGPETEPQSIRAISSPCRVSGGVVVVAMRSEGSRLEAFGARIEDGGQVTWVRHLGETDGATWLALRSAPATPVEGDGRIHWSTDRGTVITFRSSDGAIEWIQDIEGPNRSGLRDHLIEDRATDVSLRRTGSRLFVSTPGSSRITILDEVSGSSIGIIATSSPHCWNLSGDGSSLLIVEDQELVRWSCAAGTSPRFSWRLPLPKPVTGAGAAAIAASDGGWWIGSGRALLSVDAMGQNLTLQGLDLPAHSLQALDNSLMVSAGSEASILTRVESGDADSETDSMWKKALSGHIDPRWLPDLAGDSPAQRAHRSTVHLLLERSDIDLSESERTRLETALISAHPRPEDRIRIAWQRAIRAQQLGNSDGASFICQLMLREAWRNLESTRVLSKQGSTVDAATAFTHLLLQLDQQPGGQQRVARREQRAAREVAERIDLSPAPDRWIDLARSMPGCPTGRQARLEAAQSLYHLGDLEGCLLQIDYLVIHEPDSNESLIARLRRSEVLREQGLLSEAIEEIVSLDQDHGDRTLTRRVDGREIEITLSDRLRELRAEISTLPERRRDHPGLPLQLAWSGRLDLGQTRSTSVWPLSDHDSLKGDSRYLVLTTASAALFDSQDGLLLWKTELERNELKVKDGIILTRRDLPSDPLLFDATGVILHDRNRVWRLDLADGSVVWQHRMPIGGIISDEEIIIEHSCAGSGIVVLSGEDERLLAIDAQNGRVLWIHSRSGILLDDPVIEGDRLLIGYAIPNRVELRSLYNGQLVSQVDLEDDSGALASAPILLNEGFLFASERGSVYRHDDDGAIQWTTQMPHLISELHMSGSKKQLVSELFWSSEKSTLVGVDVETGAIGWEKRLAQDQRRITSLSIEGEELLIVCGDFQKRNILRLRSVLAPDEVEVPEAELEWTYSLPPAYDAVELRPSGAWIIIGDRMRGEVTILDRATGTPLTKRQGVGAIPQHLNSLGRLHHASVIGETLLTVSSRGASGFRAQPARKEQMLAWQSLQSSFNWRNEIDRLLLMQESSRAIELLEDTILDLTQDSADRAAASWLLEGATRHQARTPRRDHEIPRMVVPPLIDGSLEEPWNAQAGLPIDRPRHVRSLQGPGEPLVPWQDRADLSGRIFLGWSTEGLHLAVDIDDDIVIAHQRDSKYWIGDSLVLILDTLGDGGVRPRKDDQVLTLSFTAPRQNPPPAPEGDPDGDGGEAPFEAEEEETPDGDFVVARRPDGTGSVFEITIPWHTIATKRGESDSIPWPGMKMRIGIAVTDDDTGKGATKYLGLTPGMVLHRDLDRIWEGCAPDLMLPVRLGR